MIVAVFGKGDVDTRIESDQRRVLAACDDLAVRIEDLEQRIDGRSAAPRFDLDDAFLAAPSRSR